MADAVSIDAVLNIDQRSAVKEIERLSRVSPQIIIGINKGFLQAQIKKTAEATSVKLRADILGVKTDFKAVFKDAGKSLGEEFKGVLDNVKIDVKGGGILGSLFSAITAPIRAITTGLFERVGGNISDNLGKGISQGIEKQLSPILGNTELVGQRIGETLATEIVNVTNKGLAKLNKIPIFQQLQKEFAKDFKDFQKEALIRSRSDQLRQSKERAVRISEARTVTTQNLRRELEARPQREKRLQAATRRLQDLSGEDGQKAIKNAQERLRNLEPLIQQAQERLQQVSLGSREYQKKIKSRIKELVSQQKAAQEELNKALEEGNQSTVRFLEKEIKNRQFTIDKLKTLFQGLKSEIPDQEKIAKTVQRLTQQSERFNKELQQAIAANDTQLASKLEARIQGINQFLDQYKSFKKKKAVAEVELKDLIPQRKALEERLQKAITEQRKTDAVIINQEIQRLSETIKGLEDAQTFDGFIQPRKIKAQSQELSKLKRQYAIAKSFIIKRQKESQQLNQQIQQLQSLLAVPISAKELETLGVNIQSLLKSVKLFNIQLREQQKGQQYLARYQQNLSQTEKRIKDAQSIIDGVQLATGDSFQKASQLAGIVNQTIGVQSKLQKEAQSLLSVDTTANLFNQFQQAEQDFRYIIEVINQNANKLKNLRSQLDDPWVEQDGLQGQIDELVEFQTKSLALKQQIQASYLQLGQLPELQRIIAINNELESVEATLKKARQKGSEIDETQFATLEKALRILNSETAKREQILKNISLLQKTPAINFDQAEASQKIVTEQFRLLATQLNLSKEQTFELIELIRLSQLNSYKSISTAIERATNVRGRLLPEVYQELQQTLEQLKTVYETQFKGRTVTSESEIIKLKTLEAEIKQTIADLRAIEKLIKEYPKTQKQAQESIEQTFKLAQTASQQDLRAIRDLTNVQATIKTPVQSQNQSTNVQQKINKYLQSIIETPKEIEKAITTVIKNIEQITGTQLSQQPKIIIGKLKEGVSFSGTAIGNEAIILNERIIKDINSFQDNLFVVIHEIFHLFQNDVSQGLKTYEERLSALKSSRINIDATPDELNTYIEALNRTVQETSKVSVEKAVSYLRESLTSQGIEESVIQERVEALKRLSLAMEEGANVFALRNQDAIAETIREQFNLATETVSTAIVPSVQETGITATVKNGLQHITDAVESQVVALFNNALRSIPNDPNTIDINARQITSLSEIDAGVVKDLALKGSQETAINVLSGIRTTFKALEGAEQAVLSLDPTGIAKVVTNVLKPLAVFVAASQVPGANLLAGEATQLVTGALTPFTGALGADVTAALGGAITQLFHNIPLVGGNIEATLIQGTQQLINAAVSGGTEAIATVFTAITGGQLLRGGTEALIEKALPEANQQKALQAGKQVELAAGQLINATTKTLQETADLFQKTTQAISVTQLPASKSVFPSLLPQIDNIKGFLESNLNVKGLQDVYKQLTGTSGVQLNRKALTAVIEERFDNDAKSVQQAIAKIEESGLKANAEIKALAKPSIDENKIINESKDLASNARKALLLYTQLSDIQQQESLDRLYQVQDLVQTQLTVLSRIKQQFNVSGKASQSLGGIESQLKSVSEQIIGQIRQSESGIIDIDVANFLPEGINATVEQINKAQDFIDRMSKIVARLSNAELLPENIPQLNFNELASDQLASAAGSYASDSNTIQLDDSRLNSLLNGIDYQAIQEWIDGYRQLSDQIIDQIAVVKTLSHELRHAVQSEFGKLGQLERSKNIDYYGLSQDNIGLIDRVIGSAEGVKRSQAEYREYAIEQIQNSVNKGKIPQEAAEEILQQIDQEMRDTYNKVLILEEDAYQFESIAYLHILKILERLRLFDVNSPAFDVMNQRFSAIAREDPRFQDTINIDDYNIPNFLPDFSNLDDQLKAIEAEINQVADGNRQIELGVRIEEIKNEIARRNQDIIAPLRQQAENLKISQQALNELSALERKKEQAIKELQEAQEGTKEANDIARSIASYTVKIVKLSQALAPFTGLADDISQNLKLARFQLEQEQKRIDQLEKELLENEIALARSVGAEQAVNDKLRQVEIPKPKPLPPLPIPPQLQERYDILESSIEDEKIQREYDQAIANRQKAVSDQVDAIDEAISLNNQKFIQKVREELNSKYGFESPDPRSIEASLDRIILAFGLDASERIQAIKKSVSNGVRQVQQMIQGEVTENDIFKIDTITRPRLEITRQELTGRIDRGRIASEAINELEFSRLKIESDINNLIKESVRATQERRGEIAQEVIALDQLLNENKATTDELRKQVQLAEQAQTSLTRLGQIETNLDLGIETNDINRINQATQSVNNLERELNQLSVNTNIAQGFRQIISEIGDRLPDSVKRTIPLLRGLGVAFLGFLSFTLLDPFEWWFRFQSAIRSTIQEIEKLDALTIQLENVNLSLQESIDIAERYKIAISSVAQGYAQLSIATRNTALEGEKTRQIIEAINQTARVYNLTTDETNGIFLAFRQIASGATLQLEELNQISERVPGALQVAARAMGVTTTELKKMVTAGLVATEDFLPAFARQLEQETSLGLTNSLSSLSATRGEFDNEIKNLQLSLGENFGGLIKLVINGLSLLVKTINGSIPVLIAFGKAVTAFLAIKTIQLAIGFIVNYQANLVTLNALFYKTAIAGTKSFNAITGSTLTTDQALNKVRTSLLGIGKTLLVLGIITTIGSQIIESFRQANKELREFEDAAKSIKDEVNKIKFEADVTNLEDIQKARKEVLKTTNLFDKISGGSKVVLGQQIFDQIASVEDLGDIATDVSEKINKLQSDNQLVPENLDSAISALEQVNQKLTTTTFKSQTAANSAKAIVAANNLQIESYKELRDALEGTSIKYTDLAVARKQAIDAAEKEEIEALHEIEKLTLEGALTKEDAEIRKQLATKQRIDAELKAEKEVLSKTRQRIFDELLANDKLTPELAIAIKNNDFGKLEELGLTPDQIKKLEEQSDKVTDIERKAALERIKLAKMEKEEKERLAKERQDNLIKEIENEYQSANDLIEKKEQERIIAIKRLRASGGLSQSDTDKQLDDATKQRLEAELKAEEDNIKEIKALKIDADLSEEDRKEAIANKKEKLAEAEKRRNDLVINLLDNQIKKEEELQETLEATREQTESNWDAYYDNQKAILDTVSNTNSVLIEQLTMMEDSINRAKELSQLRFDLGTTQNKADTSRRDIKITRLERAREILKQLREDEDLTSEERRVLVSELAELGVNSKTTELQLTKQINDLEEQNRKAKLDAIRREFNFKEQQLDLERQSLELTARKAVLESSNQVNQLQQSRFDQQNIIRDNKKAFRDAKKALAKASTPEEKAAAQSQLDQAQEQLRLSQEQLGIIDQQIVNANQTLKFNEDYITQLEEINRLKQEQLETERQIAIKEQEAANVRDGFTDNLEGATAKAETRQGQIDKAKQDAQKQLQEAQKERDKAIRAAKNPEDKQQAKNAYEEAKQRIKEEKEKAITEINSQFGRQQTELNKLPRPNQVPFDVNQIYRQLPQLQIIPQSNQGNNLIVKELQLVRGELSRLKPSINQPLDLTINAQSDPNDIARKVSNAVADRDLLLLRQLGLS
jgi:tape measure domain-containing protein